MADDQLHTQCENLMHGLSKQCFKITLPEGTGVPLTKGYASPLMNLIQGNILPRSDFNPCCLTFSRPGREGLGILAVSVIQHAERKF